MKVSKLTDLEMNQKHYAKFEVPSEIKAWHEEGMRLSAQYKRCDYEITKILSQIAQHKGYLHYRCEGLRQYARFVWCLPENTVSDFVTVANKAIEFPEILEALGRGQTTVSKLRRVSSVITPESAMDWISLTEECTSREVERCVAEANPRLELKDSLTYVSGDLFDMRSTITLQVQEKLQTIADILSTQERRPLNNNEVLEIMADIVLEKIDPIRKAERAAKRKESHQTRKATEDVQKRRHQKDLELAKEVGRINRETSDASGLSEVNESPLEFAQETPQKKFGTCRTKKELSGHVKGRKTKQQDDIRLTRSSQTKREKISAALNHAVNLRDQCQCTHIGEDGERCPNRRWLETHHIVQVSEGGANTLENLTTLCSAHHRAYHAWNYH